MCNDWPNATLPMYKHHSEVTVSHVRRYVCHLRGVAMQLCYTVQLHVDRLRRDWVGTRLVAGMSDIDHRNAKISEMKNEVSRR
jgi:hypothetical protein